MSSSLYEAVIKVNLRDTADERAHAIAEGIGYAAALLHDEYGWTATAVEDWLNGVAAEVYDDEARR